MMHACLTAVFGTRQHWQSGTRSPIRKRELQRTPLEVKKNPAGEGNLGICYTHRSYRIYLHLGITVCSLYISYAIVILPPLADTK
jgi:hypothetical protein